MLARVVAGVELGGGRGVQRVALGLGRQLVLRHVGRAGRGVRVVQRVGGHPGVEGDSERGPEAPHRDPLLLLVVEGERDVPGVEGGRVEVAQLQGGDVVPGGEVAQGGGARDLDPRRGTPPSRRVAGPGGGDRDQRQQHGLADLHDPGVPGFAPAVPTPLPFPPLPPDSPGSAPSSACSAASPCSCSFLPASIGFSPSAMANSSSPQSWLEHIGRTPGEDHRPGRASQGSIGCSAPGQRPGSLLRSLIMSRRGAW